MSILIPIYMVLFADTKASAPKEGEEFSLITKDFQDLILPGITHWQHPQFLAYFPSNSTFESMIGELLASAVSNPGFSWICSPACTELEQVVLDWCAKMFGLSDEWLLSGKKGGGIIIVCPSHQIHDAGSIWGEAETVGICINHLLNSCYGC